MEKIKDFPIEKKNYTHIHTGSKPNLSKILILYYNRSAHNKSNVVIERIDLKMLVLSEKLWGSWQFSYNLNKNTRLNNQPEEVT